MIERQYGEATTLETRHDSNETVDRRKRYRQIIEAINYLKDNTKWNITAKEVAVRMWAMGYIPTSERNFTAPRLTELCEKGIVEPVGKVKCNYTGKTVTVYDFTEEYKQGDIEL